LKWDALGQRIQHFDLLRVDPDERVEVEVPIVLRGTAAGTMTGGVIEQQLRSLTIECRAFEIPDAIRVRIAELQVGQAIHVSDIELPEGIVVQDPPESLIVQVVLPLVQEEAAAGEEAAPAEPELIGRKPEEPAEEE
jgi:large subunit ribosomal protein L25